MAGQRSVFFVSDRTGITAEKLGSTQLTSFERATLIFAATLLLFAGAVFAETDNYKMVVESRFPELLVLDRHDINIDELEKELPPEQLARVRPHPQYAEADIDGDGRKDFFVLAKQRGLSADRAFLSLVTCLNEAEGYRCSILRKEACGTGACRYPIWRYLDVLDEDIQGECPTEFPAIGKPIGYFPILGCCFTVYKFSRKLGKYVDCNLGD